MDRMVLFPLAFVWVAVVLIYVMRRSNQDADGSPGGGPGPEPPTHPRPPKAPRNHRRRTMRRGNARREPAHPDRRTGKT